MRNDDTKRLLKWFRRQREVDIEIGDKLEGFRFKHDIPERSDLEGLFTPRMRDRDVRDLCEDGYLESRQIGKCKEWRYIPHEDQKPEEHTADEDAYYSVNGYFPPRESQVKML